MRGSLYDGANIIFRAKRFCDRFIYGRVIIAEQKVLKFLVAKNWRQIWDSVFCLFVCLLIRFTRSY